MGPRKLCQRSHLPVSPKPGSSGTNACAPLSPPPCICPFTRRDTPDMPDITRIFRDISDPSFIYLNVTQPDWYTVLPGRCPPAVLIAWRPRLGLPTWQPEQATAALACLAVGLLNVMPPPRWGPACLCPCHCYFCFLTPVNCPRPGPRHPRHPPSSADITAFDVLVRSNPASPNPLWSTEVIAPDFTVTGSAWPAAQVGAAPWAAVGRKGAGRPGAEHAQGPAPLPGILSSRYMPAP